MKSRKLLASPRGNVAYVDDSHVVFECGSGLVVFDFEDEINVEPYEGAKTHKIRPLQGGNDLFSENTVNKWDMSDRHASRLKRSIS